ncbi:glycosyltransferase [Nonomuraea angiospora]|uniref:glycosyltransferase n=1 Tax=Nonomuraea angiospora TaxID=46172 RepID=UPI0029BF2C37|nr:glycosyltransferase [Nonomuraea angiospora]MDX3102655.1 glycosyltransferase [Nonomuraea angiospora]
MKILVWHVHGSWTTSFVQGRHTYLVPLTPGRDADGRGRAQSFDWPSSVREVPWDRLAQEQIDLVVYQRPHEIELARDWLGGAVPGVYVEHNTPKGDVPATRHPLAGQSAIPLVHVTHFNALYWDNGIAPVRVIEHGVVDPGHRYTGELPRAAVVINEPVRRARVAGTDLLAAFDVPLDVYGMKATGLPYPAYDLPQAELHAALAMRRAYLHPYRWTSLGLALIEAMMLGLPVVALAATEAIEAVPPEAGVLSTKLPVLVEALSEFVGDPALASQYGKAARTAALSRYGIARFLDDWDRVLGEEP